MKHTKKPVTAKKLVTRILEQQKLTEVSGGDRDLLVAPTDKATRENNW